MSDIRLEGIFALRSPLSHIGETISSSAYLAEDTILQPDGTTERVASYSGNAWRGQLRDLMAAYMLDKLGRPEIGLDAFHLLFSGGRIGGPQTIDLDKARSMRSTIPMIALLGGGVGNQILQGKLRVGNSYPLCREAVAVLPHALHAEAERTAYADCTMMREYNRRDDSKLDLINLYLPAADQPLLPGQKPVRKLKNDGGAADQMRMRTELIAPGVKLRTWISGQGLTEVELGCLVSGFHRFSAHPHIGGQSGRGHGLVDLSYVLKDLETGTATEFLTVEDGACLLSPPAASAKQAYDQHLRRLYDNMLEAGGDRVRALLGGDA